MWNCCRLGACYVYTNTIMHQFTVSHIHLKLPVCRVHVCLAVTCHLHFWQNDQDLLHTTAVTQGWNRYQNKSAQTVDMEHAYQTSVMQYMYTHYYTDMYRNTDKFLWYKIICWNKTVNQIKNTKVHVKINTFWNRHNLANCEKLVLEIQSTNLFKSCFNIWKYAGIYFSRLNYRTAENNETNQSSSWM